uniref:Glucosamine--Fructose-6-Phosphate Aminotransferase n=1 Tax=Florenciella sp. virus SA2 TaxID=3240092 RepID=A0AB39J9X1_9VIRU
MCGISAMIANKTEHNVIQFLLNSLNILQNRGYDSAGICTIKDNSFNLTKYASTQTISAIDKLKSNLNKKIQQI